MNGEPTLRNAGCGSRQHDTGKEREREGGGRERAHKTLSNESQFSANECWGAPMISSLGLTLSSPLVTGGAWPESRRHQEVQKLTHIAFVADT